MAIDLSAVSGFPLCLDTGTLEVATDGGLRLDRQPRRMAQMQSVLLEPQARPPGDVVYWIGRVYDDACSEPLLARAHLAFAYVLVPPHKIGCEYAKTQGHYHPAMPGSRMSYPEVYTHYYGRLYLLMQRRAAGQAAHLDDCVLIDMQPGQSIMVPPGYAHILINASNHPALMAGLYCLDFTADYEPIRSLAGAAYYLVDQNGRECSLANRLYVSAPRLQRLTEVAGTRFAPPDNARSLWESRRHDPDAYRILTHADAAERYFPVEDQQL
jgi:oxalate decarboxylase/phosphoglucose isomerase-like protein (cupin superfamily)